MVDPDIRIKYDGGDADHGSIDMRHLGRSLQGADKIISDGLIVFIHARPPKRGERAPVSAKVRDRSRALMNSGDCGKPPEACSTLVCPLRPIWPGTFWANGGKP